MPHRPATQPLDEPHPLPLASLPSSGVAHRECEQALAAQQSQIVARTSTGIENFFNMHTIWMLQERLSLHSDFAEVLQSKESADERIELHQQFSEVFYKCDKLLVETKNQQLRAKELRAKSPRPPRAKQSPKARSKGRKSHSTRRKPR